MAILLHITLSTLVWLSIRNKTILWLLAAILWHTVVDFVIVFAGSMGWTVWAIEGVMGGMSVLNLAILWFTQKSEVAEQAPV